METECIEWTGSRNWKGYGTVYKSGKYRMAHREAYENSVGPIPKGLVIDHLCRNRGCVNPLHLEPVTNKENQARGVGTFSAINAVKTHCPQGHEYAGDNLHITPSGARVCRTCKRIRSAERYRKLKKQQT